jgi:mannosyl-glycoprotein endo-beta-N-acetylglucosaminidase
MKFKSNFVLNIQIFLCHLTNQMHVVRKGSSVIWYDSVISSGELQWQNTLNTKNNIFFDSCDGIFVNYGWTEKDPAVAAAYATDTRRFDVYFGIDVFGRGTLGGGGMGVDIPLKVNPF